MTKTFAAHLQLGLVVLITAGYLALTLTAPFKAHAEPVCGILRPMRPPVMQPLPFDRHSPLDHGDHYRTA